MLSQNREMEIHMEPSERAEGDDQRHASTFHLKSPLVSWLERFAWLPIPFFCLAIGALAFLPFETAWNPPHLLPALNILFLTCISFFISILAAKSYLAGQSTAVLFLGCGTLALGLASVLAAAPLAEVTPNVRITLYNTGVCLSGICHLVCAVWIFSANGSKLRSGKSLLVSFYFAVTAIIGILTVATHKNWLPIFFIDGQGATFWDLLILWITAGLFLISAILLRISQDENNADFQRWYGLGLGLIAVGLVGVSIQTRFGSPLNWAGRSAQYLGGVYMLVAIITSVRRTGSWSLPLKQALRDSEARFRLLSETAGRLLTAENPQGVVNELCLQVMKHLDCQVFFNFLVNEKVGKLHLNAWAGIMEEEARKIEWLDFENAVCGCVARDGIRLVADDIFNFSDPCTELVKSYGIQAYACHPLMAQDRVLGTLSFGTRTYPHFLPQDLALMKTVADQVATAMERIRLIRELKASHEQLEMRVQERTRELLKANEEISDLYENAPCGYHSLGPDGTFLQINDTELQWIGYTREEIVGKKKWSDLLTPASCRIFAKSFPILVKQGRINDLEFELVRKDGTLLPVLLNATALTDAEGRFLKSRSIIFDITERKRVEETLRRYELLSKHTREMILFISQNGRILEANEAACAAYGYDREALLSLNICDLRAPWTRDQIPFQMEKAFDQGILFETEHLRKDGTVFPVEVSSCGVTIGIERILLTIARDITERKEAQEKLNRAGAMLKMVFDGISDPLLMIDEHSVVKILNESARGYFHITNREDAIGKTCYELALGRCEPCGNCAVSSAISGGNPITFERKGLFDPERTEQVTVYPVDEIAGGGAGVIMRISDITESKNMEKHLIRADRLSSLGQLSSGIAHEIRNPLAGINLFIDILSDNEKFTRTTQEQDILNEIKLNIKRIDGIIKRVLDFSRLSETTAQSRVNVSVLLKDSLKLWHSRMTKEGILLELSVEDSLSDVLGDAIEIQQVLTNLIQNAIEAMEKGGTLSISIRNGVLSMDKKRPAVITSVKDSSPGIPSDLQKNIFNPFFTTKHTGTGLGLAISHRIVSRHGGFISFESVPGEGTTFTVELPAATES